MKAWYGRLNPWVRATGIGLIVVVVILVALDIFSSMNLAAARNEARKAGMPVTYEEVVQRLPNPPDSENAGPIIQKQGRFSQAEKTAVQDGYKYLHPKTGARDWSGIDRELIILRPRVELANSLAELPACQFERDWTKGYSLLFPEFSEMRNFVKAQVLNSYATAHRSGRLAGLREATKAAGMVKHGYCEPTFISCLVQVALVNILASCVFELAEEGPLNTAEKQEIKKIVGAMGSIPTLSESIILEPIMIDQTFSKMNPQFPFGDAEGWQMQLLLVTWLNPSVRKSIIAEYWRECIRYYKAGKLKDGDQFKTLDRVTELEKGVEKRYPQFLNPRNITMLMLLPSFTQVEEAISSLNTKFDFLKYLAGMPVGNDPFTGAPYHIVRQGGDTVIYSVGRNRKDDGGQIRGTTGRLSDLLDSGILVRGAH